MKVINVDCRFCRLIRVTSAFFRVDGKTPNFNDDEENIQYNKTALDEIH